MRTCILLCAAAVACVPALARADVVTIAPRKDATIYNDSPDRANALGPGLYLGRNSNGYIRRALIAFDEFPLNSLLNRSPFFRCHGWRARRRCGAQS